MKKKSATRILSYLVDNRVKLVVVVDMVAEDMLKVLGMVQEDKHLAVEEDTLMDMMR